MSKGALAGDVLPGFGEMTMNAGAASEASVSADAVMPVRVKKSCRMRYCQRVFAGVSKAGKN